MTERQVVPAPGANRFGTVFMKRSAASGTRSWSAAARSASSRPAVSRLVDRAVQRVDDGLLDVIGIGTLRLGERRDGLSAAHRVAQLGDLHVDGGGRSPSGDVERHPACTERVLGRGRLRACVRAGGRFERPPAVPMAPTLSSPAAASAAMSFFMGVLLVLVGRCV